MPVSTVGTSGIIAVYANIYRTSLEFENRSATANVYVEHIIADPLQLTTGNGSIKMGPNEAITINYRDDGIIVKKQWNIISDTASTTFSYTEGFNFSDLDGYISSLKTVKTAGQIESTTINVPVENPIAPSLYGGY